MLKELIEALNVLSADVDENCIVLEQCSVYDAVLSHFRVVCKEYNVPLVEKWIRNNITSSVDHCIHMFQKKPEAIMKFIVASQNAKSLTEEFVKECGGVQGFLDKYAKQEEEEPLKKLDDFGKTEDTGAETETDNNTSGRDEITDEAVTEGVADAEVQNTADGEEQDTLDGKVSVNNKPIPGSPEALAAALEILGGTSGETLVDKPPLEEAVKGNDAEEGIFAGSELKYTDRPLTADEQLQEMLELQRKEDALRNGIPLKEDQEDVEESVLPEEVVEVSVQQEVQKPIVAQELVDSLFTSSGEFASFTENQTVAVMRMIKQIEPGIRLDGLEPGNILTKEEMMDSREIIQSFSPGVFKRFMLYQMENASSDYELIRTTVMLDDFCNFINKEFGGMR